MKNIEDAKAHALGLSQKHNGAEYLVVLDPDLYDIPDNDFHVISAEAFEEGGFFQGCTVSWSTDEAKADL